MAGYQYRLCHVDDVNYLHFEKSILTDRKVDEKSPVSELTNGSSALRCTSSPAGRRVSMFPLCAEGAVSMTVERRVAFV